MAMACEQREKCLAKFCYRNETCAYFLDSLLQDEVVEMNSFLPI